MNPLLIISDICMIFLWFIYLSSKQTFIFDFILYSKLVKQNVFCINKNVYLNNK